MEFIDYMIFCCLAFVGIGLLFMLIAGIFKLIEYLIQKRNPNFSYYSLIEKWYEQNEIVE